MTNDRLRLARRMTNERSVFLWLLPLIRHAMHGELSFVIKKEQ